MEKMESTRIQKLERLGQMDQSLVETGELIEEVTGAEVPNRFPLMLLLIIGIDVVIAAWLFIIFLGIGNATVQTTLGTHFTR